MTSPILSAIGFSPPDVASRPLEGHPRVNDSLSIIVPVRNAEATLPGQVARLLDLLPDLTARFEIVLVDDASSDQTIDVARELTANYPQVRLIRHREQRGTEAAVRTGLQWAQGRVMFVQEAGGALSPADLRQLWARRHDEELVLAGTRSRPGVFDSQLLERLSAWGQAVQASAKKRDAEQKGPAAGGLHMIHRGALAHLLAADQASGLPDEGVAVGESLSRADRSHPPVSGRRATNFLRHLKNLALGE